MSRSRRTDAPHQRDFDQRLVERINTQGGGGLSTDSIRTPRDGYEELENARDYGTEIRGQIGSEMHNRADYQVAPLSTESYLAAQSSGGTLYIAAGNVVPVVGEIFFTATPTDYSNGELTDAKRLVLNNRQFVTPGFDEDFPRTWAFDFFRIADDPLPTYIGNLAVAHFRGYIARIVDGVGLFSMKISKSGVSITRDITATDPFVPELAGMYIVYGDDTGGVFSGKRDFISGFSNGNLLTVSVADTVPDGDYVFCAIQPKIHAQHYHQAQQKLFLHAGEEIYQLPIPIFKWEKLSGMYDKKPFPSESLFQEVKGDLILTNSNGHYRINVDQRNTDELPCYWKINSNEPDKPRNKTVRIFGFPTSEISNDENPYVIAGFSGELSSGGSNGIGGQIV